VPHGRIPAAKAAFQRGQVAQVVERSPEKAGVGGSTPSLATTFQSLTAPARNSHAPPCNPSKPPQPLVSNGTQFCLICSVQWSTTRVVQTVVETPTYLAVANKLFGEQERADIVALVAADPQCGDVIRGTGGFRKVRVARKGMGKSGGARVVYIWRNDRFPVFLIAVFPKNEKENLSMAERNALKKRADSIFETYGS
jgi:hypothetical protein